MAQFTKATKEIPNKTLTIKMFDRNAPDYVFYGEWAGRDIKVVGRTIARAYRRHTLARRRELLQEAAPTQSDANLTAPAVPSEV